MTTGRTTLTDALQRWIGRADGLLVVGLFAILPLEHTPGLRYLLCLVLGLRGLWLLVREPIRHFLAPARALLPWLAWASASYFWSSAPATTLAHLKHDLWLPMLAFLGGYQLFRHRCSRTLLLWAVAAGTLTNAVVTLCGATPPGYPLYPLRWASYYFSTTGYSSTYALYFSALALPWAFRTQGGQRSPRLLSLAVLALNLVVAVVDKNRMFFVAEALLLAMLLGGIVRMPRFAVFTAGAALVVLAVFFIRVDHARTGSDVASTGGIAHSIDKARSDPRFRIWKYWIDRSIAVNVLGAGFGRSVPTVTLSPEELSTFESLDPFATLHSHNLFLQTLLETGWGGLVCWVLLLGQFFRQFLRLRPTDEPVAAAGLLLLLAVILKNMTDVFTLFGPAVLFYAALGILSGSAGKTEPPRPTPPQPPTSLRQEPPRCPPDKPYSS